MCESGAPTIHFHSPDLFQHPISLPLHALKSKGCTISIIIFAQAENKNFGHLEKNTVCDSQGTSYGLRKAFYKINWPYIKISIDCCFCTWFGVNHLVLVRGWEERNLIWKLNFIPFSPPLCCLLLNKTEWRWIRPTSGSNCNDKLWPANYRSNQAHTCMCMDHLGVKNGFKTSLKG